MNKKLILLNGGKGCGKTDAVSKLKQLLPSLQESKCKDHLHELTMRFFCVEEGLYWRIYEDREAKELPNMNFLLKIKEANKLYDYLEKPRHHSLLDHFNIPLTIREAMIYVSEIVCKPAFGEDYFGQARIKHILNTNSNIFIDDSTGFEAELYPAIEKLGQENILLIRIKGRGDFEGDSRDFINDGVINNTVDIYNTSDLQSYLTKLEKEVLSFV